MIVHMVMFKFENEADAKASQEKLLAMRGRVPSMLSIEAGLDFTKSDRSYDLGLVTHHKTQEDLEAYRVDPVHQEVAAFIGARKTAAAAVDFEQSEP